MVLPTIEGEPWKPLNEKANRQAFAMQLVKNFIDSDRAPLPVQHYDIFVVWFCFTLGNWKCLISTDMPDNKYYEVTYNKNTDETYLDVYEKTANLVHTSDGKTVRGSYIH